MDDPYRYCSQEREDTVILKKEYLELAREAACKSMVLLKNENQLLPLSEKLKSVAIIGPLADSKKICRVVGRRVVILMICRPFWRQ